MNPVILHHVLPLVGHVHMGSFDMNKFGNVMSLQMKMVKHIQNNNSDKLKMYLAFCMQEWSKPNDCPIDIKIIKDAIGVIKEFN